MKNIIVLLNSIKSVEEFSFIYNDHGLHFQKLVKNEKSNFDLIGFSKELSDSLNDFSFDWYELLLKSDYKNRINYSRNIDFGRTLFFTFDDLISLIDVIDYSSMTNLISESSLKKRLRETIYQNYLPDFKGIEDFLNKKLNWLDFEVKYQFLKKIGYDKISNEDIIFLIKSYCRDYLYPDYYNQNSLNDFSFKANSILKSYQENNGWLEINNLLYMFKSDCFELDMFTLSKLKWDNCVDSIKHYKNDLNIGFKKYVLNNSSFTKCS